MSKHETVACFMKEGFPYVEAYLLKNFTTKIIKEESVYNDFYCYDDHEYDYIISFLSPWILPEFMLKKARKNAINFHPAPSKYPGSAGYNLAIYNKDKRYGVTCHEMVAQVDSGRIYATKTFPLEGNETVEELRHHSHVELEALFYWVMADIHLIDKGNILNWECEPHKFKELQALCDCTNIEGEELALRVRACYFPGAKDYPYKMINGNKIKLMVE